MDHRAVAALASAAEVIHAAARSHKRAEEAHRRQARQLMGQLDELRRECRRLGFNLEITAPKGGTDSDGRNA